METYETFINREISHAESLGCTFIDGYPIPNTWVDLINEDLSAADVMAHVVSFGGHITNQYGPLGEMARSTYNSVITDEVETGISHPSLESARTLAARNARLRENGRVAVSFDEHFKWPSIA